MTKLRRLKREDIPDLTRLARSVWLATFSEGLLEEDLEDGLKIRNEAYFEKAQTEHLFWLAEQEGGIVGFVEYGDYAEGGTEIKKLYVATELHGKGLGRQLLRKALNDTLIIGQPIYLDVWSENKSAIGLYQSEGFEIIEEREFVAPSGVPTTPDYIMCKGAIK